MPYFEFINFWTVDPGLPKQRIKIFAPYFNAYQLWILESGSMDMFKLFEFDCKTEDCKGSLCFVCDLYSFSETTHTKSPWIHQREQKNYL